VKISIVSPKGGIGTCNDEFFSTLIVNKGREIHLHYCMPISQKYISSIGSEFYKKHIIELKEKK